MDEVAEPQTDRNPLPISIESRAYQPVRGLHTSSASGSERIMGSMSEEVELAAETTGAVMKALADASGVVEPVREFSEYIASTVHYRYFPKLVDRAMRAAQKIEASGLPRRAFSEVRDPLLKAILEGGAMEDDPTLQECWENLLANALVDGPAQVKAAFPKVLSELDPAEALTLERLAAWKIVARGQPGMVASLDDHSGILADGWENLERLGLIHMVAAQLRPPQLARVGNHVHEIQDVAFTTLGFKFIQACQAPVAPDTSVDTASDLEATSSA